MRRFSASASFMFRELPLIDRFGAMAQAGFEGVEIQILAEGEPDVMARAARRAGLAVVLVNVGMGDFLEGGSGLSGVPGMEPRFRAELERTLAAAETLEAGFVHIGPSRIPAGESRATCLSAYRANLDFALDRLLRSGSGATLLIEPINRKDNPTALWTRSRDVGDFIRAHYSGAIGLQFDLYHEAMNQADPVVAFGDVADLARHVQFSDMPGRQPPGCGALDFVRLFSGLEAAGYAGWFGAEYFPKGPTADSLGWMAALR